MTACTAPSAPTDLQLRRLRLGHLVEWVRARQKDEGAQGQANMVQAEPAANQAELLNLQKAIVRRWLKTSKATSRDEDQLWRNDGALRTELEVLGGLALDFSAPTDNPHAWVENWLRKGTDAPAWAIHRELHSPPGTLRLIEPDGKQHTDGWCFRYLTEVHSVLTNSLWQALRQIAVPKENLSGAANKLQLPMGLLDPQSPNVFTDRSITFNKDSIETWFNSLSRFDVLPVFSWWQYIAGGLMNHLTNAELMTLAKALSFQPPELSLLDAGRLSPRSKIEFSSDIHLEKLSPSSSPVLVTQRDDQIRAGNVSSADLEFIEFAMSAPVPENYSALKIQSACRRLFERLAGVPPASSVVPRSNAYETAVRCFRLGNILNLSTIEQGSAAMVWSILRPKYDQITILMADATQPSLTWHVSPGEIGESLLSRGLHFNGDQIYHHLKKMLIKSVAVGEVLRTLREAQGQEQFVHANDAIMNASVSFSYSKGSKGDWVVTVTW